MIFLGYFTRSIPSPAPVPATTATWTREEEYHRSNQWGR